MRTRIAINGLDTVGRTVLRVLSARADRPVDLVAVNDVGPTATLGYLIKHDSTYGECPVGIAVDGDDLLLDGRRLRCSHHRWADDLDWRRHGVDIVVETSRGFRAADEQCVHTQSGGARAAVLATADAPADVVVLPGVNDDDYDPSAHETVSAGDPAAHCAVPVLDALHRAFGVENAALVAVQGFTGDEHILDTPDPDIRRARSAVGNLVVTGTPTARTVSAVLPALAGRLTAVAVHVPVADAASLAFTVRLRDRAPAGAVNEAVRAAADGPLKGLVRYADEPVVSSDVRGEAASCVLDAGLTAVTGDLVTLVGWFDPRWAYAHRVVDLVELVARRRAD